MPEATVTAEPPPRVPPPGLVPMASDHRGGVVRGLDVAVGVLDRHLHGRGDGRSGGGVGGALDEGQLGRWADGRGGPNAWSCMTQAVPFWVAVPA